MSPAISISTPTVAVQYSSGVWWSSLNSESDGLFFGEKLPVTLNLLVKLLTGLPWAVKQREARHCCCGKSAFSTAPRQPWSTAPAFRTRQMLRLGNPCYELVQLGWAGLPAPLGRQGSACWTKSLPTRLRGEVAHLHTSPLLLSQPCHSSFRDEAMCTNETLHLQLNPSNF